MKDISAFDKDTKQAWLIVTAFYSCVLVMGFVWF
jgi:hypothetical protein